MLRLQVAVSIASPAALPVTCAHTILAILILFSVRSFGGVRCTLIYLCVTYEDGNQGAGDVERSLGVGSLDLSGRD